MPPRKPVSASKTKKTRVVVVEYNYVPEFKGPIEGWLANNVARNLWRLQPLYEREDAMQEGFIVFMRCAAKYPILDNGAHFMALFKRAWNNRLNDLSVKASRTRALHVDQTYHLPADMEVPEAPGDLDNDGLLGVMIRQAPREVLMVLNLLLNAPQELLALATRAWEASESKNSDMMNRLLGLPDEMPVMTKVRDYFTTH